jgi:hypothetical protein
LLERSSSGAESAETLIDFALSALSGRDQVLTKRPAVCARRADPAGAFF